MYAATKLVEKELGWQAKFTMKDMCEFTVKICASKSSKDYDAYGFINSFILFTLCTLHGFRFGPVDVAAEEPEGLQSQ